MSDRNPYRTIPYGRQRPGHGYPPGQQQPGHGYPQQLVKERTTTGYVQVTVNGGNRHHATTIAARGDDVFAVSRQVTSARSLSA